MSLENTSQETSQEQLEKRYEILIKARNFHYENFNKWMTYFYVMIAALVVGLCNIVSKNDSDNNEDIILYLSSLGFIISLFWHWANKGYYYWNINFITLVNHYEKNLLKFKESERVYFTFANKEIQDNYFNPISGANFSTSKISILLSFIITMFWAFLISRISLNGAFNQDWLFNVCSILFPICVIFILSYLASKYLYSFHDHFPNLKIKTKKWIENNDNEIIT